MPRRVLQLSLGLALFGFGISLVLKSNLGAASWDVLTQGLSYRLPLTFGTITILMSGIVLLCWIPLRQRVGFGTVANAVLVGVFADIGIAVFAVPEAFWLRLVVMLFGIVLVGLASGLYIGAGFGSGPRDGLMIGLHELTGIPIWVVRTALEVVVVFVGWLLGGTVGIGTLAFALLIGPLCQVFLPLFAITDRTHETAAVDPALEAPSVVTETAALVETTAEVVTVAEVETPAEVEAAAAVEMAAEVETPSEVELTGADEFAGAREASTSGNLSDEPAASAVTPAPVQPADGAEAGEPAAPGSPATPEAA